MFDERQITRWPLQWPIGWARRRNRAARSNFSMTREVTETGRRSTAVNMATATERLEQQLTMLGATNPILSTNVSLSMRGVPRGDENPTDPGVAVYFSFKGKATVLACDTYARVADNIAALAGHIKALRAIERYGVGTIEQALAGYKALPADWRSVFGYKPQERVTKDDLTSRFKMMARDRHPDRAHDDGAAMAHLNRARDYALDELA